MTRHYDQFAVHSAYDVLGVSPDASTDEIERAYKKLMLAVHPDRSDGAHTLAALVNEARRVLVGERAAYDAWRAAGGRTESPSDADPEPAPDPWDVGPETVYDEPPPARHPDPPPHERITPPHPENHPSPTFGYPPPPPATPPAPNYGYPPPYGYPPEVVTMRVGGLANRALIGGFAW